MSYHPPPSQIFRPGPAGREPRPSSSPLRCATSTPPPTLGHVSEAQERGTQPGLKAPRPRQREAPMPAPHTTLAPRILLPPCSLVTLSSEVASTLGRSPAREISVGALRRAGPAGGGDGGIGHVPWVTTHLPYLGYYPPTLPGLLPTVSHGGTSTTDLTVHYYFSPLLYYPSLPVQSTTSRKVQNDRSTVINGSKRPQPRSSWGERTLMPTPIPSGVVRPTLTLQVSLDPPLPSRCR